LVGVLYAKCFVGGSLVFGLPAVGQAIAAAVAAAWVAERCTVTGYRCKFITLRRFNHLALLCRNETLCARFGVFETV
jgi:hypothetical protein